MKRNSKFLLYGIGAVVVIVLLGLLFKAIGGNEDNKQIKKNNKNQTKAEATMQNAEANHIAMGYEGVILGINVVQAASSPYNAIGTSGEEVLVGQRMTEREIDTLENVGDQVKESVDNIDEQSWKLAERTKMSDGDYETLLAIVEAEAGGEDIDGRMLVANVILNRVNYADAFPTNITDVVWERAGGAAQFSPTRDGRIGRVTISDTTREAVNRVIDGEDISQGALFFMGKATAEEHNQKWFNGNLKFLFEHGVHSFYTY